MKLKKALAKVNFRKGNWIIHYDEPGDSFSTVDFNVETPETLAELWKDFRKGNGISASSVVELEEGYDPAYGAWCSKDRILSDLRKQFEEAKAMSLKQDESANPYSVLAVTLAYAEKVIREHAPDEEIWIDGPER